MTDEGDPDGGPLVGAGANGFWLTHRWGDDPAAPALLAAGASRWCTTGELDRASASAAAALAGSGLQPGDRLLWSSSARFESVLVLLGALRLGAVVVPGNPAWTEPELAHVVSDVEPRLALVAEGATAGWVRAACAGTVCVTPEQIAVPGVSADGSTPPPTVDAADPSDPAMIIYTSGTTGTPKGAVLSHGNLGAGAESLRAAWGWVPADRLVSGLPLFHVHGLCVGLLSSLAGGASVALVEPFDAGVVLDAVEREAASLFFGVPTMYHRLLSTGRARRLSSLRLCVSGSAPLSVELWRRLRDEAGVEVLERYGMTETLLTVSNPLVGERRAGAVGLPLGGVAVRVEPLAPEASNGSEGELWVRGPTVFSGYWRQPEATAAAFTDGWFRTGDLVSVDDSEYLTVRGRSRDLIITGGFNVYPAEVEEVLAAHPGVAEVAVAGRPSEEWGETVCAWVVPAPAASTDVDLAPEELLEFAAARLAPHKRPREVRFVETLPRNPLGKVVRRQLP